MVTPTLSREIAIETWTAYINFNRNSAQAAQSLGIPAETFKSRKRRAFELAALGTYGTDFVLPGFEISSISTTTDAEGNIRSTSIKQRPDRGAETFPTGMQIAGLSRLVDQSGNSVLEWQKFKPGEVDPFEMADRIVKRYDDMQFAIPVIPAPSTFSPEYINLLPLADMHLGLRVWAKEAEGANWDLDIACKTYRGTLEKLFARMPPADTCVILGGGDQMHADNNSNRTPNSGNALDVDGRYDRVVEYAQDLFLDIIAMALQRHQNVIVRILKGNHDEHATTAIVGFLRGAFRDNPRVDIVTSPNKFWTHQHGLTMLSATHGDMAKPKQMPSIMAARWPEMWGSTKHRYAHCFHVHHREKIKDEAGGAIVDTYTSPAPQDAWHYGMGYVSSRLMEAVTYSSVSGWVGNIVEPVTLTSPARS